MLFKPRPSKTGLPSTLRSELVRREIRPPACPSFFSDPTTPLLRLTDRDVLPLAAAYEGILSLGQTGSGKSSGFARTLAQAFLKLGMGGIVLCTKADEANNWLKYARETGRSASIVHVKDDGRYRLNFLDYAARVAGPNAVNACVDVLMRAFEASRAAKARPGSDGEEFWTNSVFQILLNSLQVLHCAHGRIRLQDLRNFLASAPQSEAQALDTEWRKRSFCYATLEKAHAEPIFPISEHDLIEIASYWRHDFARLDGKTRGNIVITASTLLARFQRGRLYELFGTETTFVPEMTFNGAILLLDLPIKIWGEDGVIAQQIIKYLWQRAAEARGSDDGAEPRPLFAFADECAFILASYDAEFTSTARSSRVANVYISQSLPTLYAKMGGPNPQHYTDALLANLTHKVFLANGCAVTNKWAAETIGQHIVERRTRGKSWGESGGGSDSTAYQRGTGQSWSSGSGSSSGPHGGQASSSFSRGGTKNDGWTRTSATNDGWTETDSESFSEQKDFKIDPDVFASHLRTGGALHGGLVDAIWFHGGSRFRQTRTSWAMTTFRQGGTP